MQRTKKIQNNFEKKRAMLELHYLTWTHYKSTVISVVWYWHQDIQINQRNRIESSGTSPLIHDRLSFEKGPSSTQWRQMAHEQLDINM